MKRVLARMHCQENREKKKESTESFSLKASRRNKSCLILSFFLLTPLESVCPITCSDVKEREGETRVFFQS
jgi:hypothetical protein